jgi:hypothetical protein
MHAKSESERPERIVAGALRMDQKIVCPLTVDQIREKDSIRKANAWEWTRQTLLNSAVSNEDFENLLETLWSDQRNDTPLRETYSALSAACMSKTLKENTKDED